MGATGDGSTPLDEAVRLVTEVGETAAPEPRSSRSRWRKSSNPEIATAPAPGVTVLSRHLLTGVLASDRLLTRLSAATGQTREQILGELSTELTEWVNTELLRVHLLETRSGCLALEGPENATYSGLGERIEHLLRLAEEQATTLMEAARAEAATLPAAACPRCGGT